MGKDDQKALEKSIREALMERYGIEAQVQKLLAAAEAEESVDARAKRLVSSLGAVKVGRKAASKAPGGRSCGACGLAGTRLTPAAKKALGAEHTKAAHEKFNAEK